MYKDDGTCDWWSETDNGTKLKINMEPKESKSKRHFYLSILKSCIRIAAGICMLQLSLYGQAAGALLIIAEIFGIFEEM